LRPSSVIEPRCPVAKVCAATATAERAASRKSFADLPSPVSKLKQAENPRRLVAIRVGDDGNAGGPAAGVELDSDRLNIAPDAVLQADRERVAAMYNRPAAFEKQASPLLGARHDRPLALIEDEYRQFRLLNFALTGLVTLPLRAISPRECCKPAFEQDPFRANPWLVCCLAFERSELRKHSDVGLEPDCNVAWGRSPKLTLVTHR
jgi:hypothetical protein